MMNSTAYSIALTTVASEADAKRIARLLVEQCVAACVSIIPEVRSFYKWKNQLCEEVEWVLLIKTRIEFRPSIEEIFSKNHPYELPELVFLSMAEGTKDYFSWMDQVLGMKNP